MGDWAETYMLELIKGVSMNNTILNLQLHGAFNQIFYCISVQAPKLFIKRFLMKHNAGLNMRHEHGNQTITAPLEGQTNTPYMAHKTYVQKQHIIKRSYKDNTCAKYIWTKTTNH